MNIAFATALLALSSLGGRHESDVAPATKTTARPEAREWAVSIALWMIFFVFAIGVCHVLAD